MREQISTAQREQNKKQAPGTEEEGLICPQGSGNLLRGRRMLGVCQVGVDDALVPSLPYVWLTSCTCASRPHPSFIPCPLQKTGLGGDSSLYKMAHTITIAQSTIAQSKRSKGFVLKWEKR